MKKIIIIALACYGLSAQAQVRESENFVYLFSDSVVYANRITIRPNFSNSLVLRADAKRIPMTKVKFFNNEHGFFANTGGTFFGGDIQFAERVAEGKINFYRHTGYEVSDFGRPFHSIRREREAVDMRMYYNRGYENLKKVSYENLKQEMADNSTSMVYLKKYRSNQRTAKTMFVAAGASILTGFILFVATGNKEFEHTGIGYGNVHDTKFPNYTASYVLMGLGTGLAVGGYGTYISGMRRLDNAVDSYNR